MQLRGQLSGVAQERLPGKRSGVPSEGSGRNTTMLRHTPSTLDALRATKSLPGRILPDRMTATKASWKLTVRAASSHVSKVKTGAKVNCR